MFSSGDSQTSGPGALGASRTKQKNHPSVPAAVQKSWLVWRGVSLHSFSALGFPVQSGLRTPCGSASPASQAAFSNHSVNQRDWRALGPLLHPPPHRLSLEDGVLLLPFGLLQGGQGHVCLCLGRRGSSLASRPSVSVVGC